jgi:hypothetical protein
MNPILDCLLSHRVGVVICAHGNWIFMEKIFNADSFVPFPMKQ